VTAGYERVTRGGWFRRVLAAGGGLASGGVVAAGCGSLATSSPSQRDDVSVLNFALAFEELQADFYARALRTASLRGEWLQFAQVVGGHERAHVAFLRSALGSAAKPAPRFALTRSPGDLHEFQRVAIELEDIGVAMYNGQAGNVSKKTLAAAAEIVSVEARHASWARDLAGETPAPVASDQPADITQVRARLSQLGVRTV
jgi:hypothetical protein